MCVPHDQPSLDEEPKLWKKISIKMPLGQVFQDCLETSFLKNDKKALVKVVTFSKNLK